MYQLHYLSLTFIKVHLIICMTSHQIHVRWNDGVSETTYRTVGIYILCEVNSLMTPKQRNRLIILFFSTQIIAKCKQGRNVGQRLSQSNNITSQTMQSSRTQIHILVIIACQNSKQHHSYRKLQVIITLIVIVEEKLQNTVSNEFRLIKN